MSTEVVCVRVIPPLMILLMMLLTPFLGTVPAPELNEQIEPLMVESIGDEVALLSITYPPKDTIFRSGELVELTTLVANLGTSSVTDLELEVGLWKSTVLEGLSLEDSWELQEFWTESAICEDCFHSELESGEILGGYGYDVLSIDWFAETGEYRFIVDIVSSTDTNLSNNQVIMDFGVYEAFDIRADILWNHNGDDFLDLSDDSISTTCPANGFCYDFTVEVSYGLLDVFAEPDFEIRDIVVEINVTNSGVLDAFMVDLDDGSETHFYSDGNGEQESSYFINEIGKSVKVPVGHYPNGSSYEELGDARYVAEMYKIEEFMGSIQVDGSDNAFQVEARVASFKLWQNTTVPLECVEINQQLDIDPLTGEPNGTIPEWLPCEIEMTKDTLEETDMSYIRASDDTFDDLILKPIIFETKISPSRTPSEISQGANDIFFEILYGGDDIVGDTYEFAIDVTINLIDYGKTEVYNDVNSLDNPDDSPLGYRCSIQREDHKLVGGGVEEEALCFTYHFPLEGRYEITAEARIVNGYTDEISSNNVQTYQVNVKNQAPFVIMELDAPEPLTLGDTFLIRLSGLDYDAPSDDSRNYRYDLTLVDEEGEETPLACIDESQSGPTKFCEGRITTQWIKSTHLKGLVTDLFGAESYAEIPILVWAKDIFNDNSGDFNYEVSYRSDNRLEMGVSNDINEDGTVNSQDRQTGVVLGNLPGTYDSVGAWDLSQISELPTLVGIQELELTFQLPNDAIRENSNGTLWYFNVESSEWENIATGVSSFDGFTKEQTISWSQDGGDLLPSGLYAVFIAKQGNAPSVGVSEESVVNLAGGIVDVSWELDGTLKSDEWLAIYYSSGTSAFDNSNGDADSQIITNRFTTSWRFSEGTHLTNYQFTIRTENAYGPNLDGAKSNSTIVDSAVDPEPVISNLLLTLQSSNVLVTWESSNTVDVDHWKVCRGVDPNSLSTCYDSTGTAEQMITTKPTIKVKWFYAVSAVDQYGNSVQLGQSTLDLSSAGDVVTDDGDGTIGTQVEGGLPSWTFPAIGGVVFLSVIVGVILVVRGGGSDELDQDWDY